MDSRTVLDRVRREVLFDGLFDWGDLGWVRGIVLDYREDNDEEWVKKTTLEVVESLARDGLVEIGSIGENGFSPWSKTVDESIRQIRDYASSHDDWNFYAWTRNTPTGKSLAESFDPAEFRDDDD
jgi:hypothetical protein